MGKTYHGPCCYIVKKPTVFPITFHILVCLPNHFYYILVYYIFVFLFFITYWFIFPIIFRPHSFHPSFPLPQAVRLILPQASRLTMQVDLYGYTISDSPAAGAGRPRRGDPRVLSIMNLECNNQFNIFNFSSF